MNTEPLPDDGNGLTGEDALSITSEKINSYTMRLQVGFWDAKVSRQPGCLRLGWEAASVLNLAEKCRVHA